MAQKDRKYSLQTVTASDFVAEVRNISLSDRDSLDPATVWSIKQDVAKHKILVFKNQGVISPQRQIEISEHFGEIEEAGFDQHEKSPDRKILRVSNDEAEGFKLFGTGGWHVDGTFMRKPNTYSIYHIINCPSKGTTGFLPLYEVYESLNEETRDRWQRLHIVKTFKQIRGFTDKPGYVVHPLLYPHPTTGRWTFCIHQGKTRWFIWDKGAPYQRKTSREEAVSILEELDHQFNWEPGDFIISDNLAVAHWATPDTQLSRSEVGLRVMHRTVIKGVTRPRKPWDRPSSHFYPETMETISMDTGHPAAREYVAKEIDSAMIHDSDVCTIVMDTDDVMTYPGSSMQARVVDTTGHHQGAADTQTSRSDKDKCGIQ